MPAKKVQALPQAGLCAKSVQRTLLCDAESLMASGIARGQTRSTVMPMCAVANAAANREHGSHLVEVPTSEGSLLVPYEIRRSRRARYIRLTLGHAGQARLSVPWYCASAEAVAFLRTQGEWLQKQMAKAPVRVSLRHHLDAHPQVSALGHTLHARLGRTRGRSYYLYSLRPPEALFQLACASAGADPEAELLAQLRDFAREVIPHRVQTLAEEHGIRYKRVSVRDQASRWGSCSSTGTISLNWRLVLLRPQLQDHVILHELAHLKEMNHSERFWKLLRSYDPHCDAHDSQLNVAAAKLMPLGRV